MSEKRRKVGSLSIRIDGHREFAGAVITSPWEGNYGVIPQINTGKTDENDRPVMAPLSALRFTDPETGEHIYREFEPWTEDRKDTVTLYVNEDLVGKPFQKRED